METAAETSERLKLWEEKWEKKSIGFHKSKVNDVLMEQISKLHPKNKTVFVPLCGKTLDMKWLADQGYLVVGLDGVKTALEDFCKEHDLEWIEKDIQNKEYTCKMLETKEGNIKLFCADMMLFDKCFAGQFDVIWDRASIVAINREDTERYINVIKDVLSPEGTVILSTVEYDLAIMEAYDDVPPPHPMFEADLKTLFGPEFVITFLCREDMLFRGKENIHAAYYRITRTK